MAVLTFYPSASFAPGSGFRSLQTSAPGSTADIGGWVVAKTAATVYSRTPSFSGSEIASPTWNAAVPTEAISGTTTAAAGNGFRTVSTYTGSFASTDWSFQSYQHAVSANAGSGSMMFKLWRGASADGASATAITGWLTGSVANVKTAAYANSTVAFNPGAVDLNNEYLFIQLSWKITLAGGSNNSDCNVGSTGTMLVTADFTDKFVQTWRPRTLGSTGAGY